MKFKNTGKETIRLVNKFTPKLMRILFFSVNIKNEQGNTVVRSPVMANVSFREPMPYKVLEPGKSYSVTVPLDERIRDSNNPRGGSGDYKLPPGKYTVELTYRS